MTTTQKEAPVIQAARHLKALGIEPHWCHPNSKMPVGKGWNSKGPKPIDQLISEFRPGYNIGIHLGINSTPDFNTQLVVVDVDIKSTDPKDKHEAYNTLKRYLGDDLSLYPKILSGRGGGSAHFWVQVPMDDVPPTNRIAIIKSKGTTSYISGGKKATAPKWAIDILVKGNAIVPPSVHPDTNKQYLWEAVAPQASTIPLIPPALQALIESDAAVVVGDLPPIQLTAIDLQQINIPADLIGLIENGDLAGQFSSRSELLYHVINELVLYKLDDSQIASIITDSANAISDKPLERGANDPLKAALWVQKYIISKARANALAIDASNVFDDDFVDNYQPEEQPPEDLFFPASSLHNQPVNKLQFIVDNWFPRGFSGLLSASGGKGKSLEALHMAACIALGHPYRKNPVVQGSAFVIACEDDKDEIHRRLNRVLAVINKERFQADPTLQPFTKEDLTDLHLYDGVGRNNLLMSFDRATGVQTKLFHDLVNEMKTIHKTTPISFILIDTVADTFAGNENDRSHTRQYISQILNQSAHYFDCFVLALGHMNKGESQYSGSTAWQNSVRIAMSLDDPIEEHDEHIWLSSNKANYSRPERIALIYNPQLGAFELLDAQQILNQQQQAMGQAKDAVLAAISVLIARGERMSNNRSAGNWVAKLAAEVLQTDDTGLVMRCFDQLRADGVLQMHEYDKRNRRSEVQFGANGASLVSQELVGRILQRERVL